jgi:hypothetical protein
MPHVLQPSARGSLAAVLVLGALVPATPAATPDAIRAAIAKGSTFLTEQEQAADGSFSAEVGPAVTALAVTALVRSGTPADAPAVK